MSESSATPDRNPEVEHLLVRTQIDAHYTSHFLTESWKRTVRHDHGFERLALWHTVNLAVESHRVLDEKASPSVLLSLASERYDADARYEVEAAMRMILAHIPYAQQELDQLSEVTAVDREIWREGEAECGRYLVARWHSWLWDKKQSEVSASAYGRASELAVAASRLTRHLPLVLGWQDET
jgi:hypothetical protein